MKIGDQVRHLDGTLGTVTHIHVEGKMVEWKSCGVYRFSHIAALTAAPEQQHRWRKDDAQNKPL
jgi:hypothetical protein